VCAHELVQEGRKHFCLFLVNKHFWVRKKKKFKLEICLYSTVRDYRFFVYVGDKKTERIHLHFFTYE